MVDTIYSIGYSGFSINDFINTLKHNCINLIIDVRSMPYSQRYYDYNKESLEQKLKNNRIYYRNYSKEFGARQSERKYYTREGYLDFELFAKSAPFLQGFDKLRNSMAQNFKIALMCAEKDPVNCHRSILVARAFHDAGYKIIHLLPNNILLSQEDIEDSLLTKFFPNREQITLFDENLSKHEYISRAYKKQNSAIGYSIKEEEE